MDQYKKVCVLVRGLEKEKLSTYKIFGNAVNDLFESKKIWRTMIL